MEKNYLSAISLIFKIQIRMFLMILEKLIFFFIKKKCNPWINIKFGLIQNNINLLTINFGASKEISYTYSLIYGQNQKHLFYFNNLNSQ